MNKHLLSFHSLLYGLDVIGDGNVDKPVLLLGLDHSRTLVPDQEDRSLNVNLAVDSQLFDLKIRNSVLILQSY